MAKTVIIGKVAVKVHPDTTGFKREAERELRDDERRMEFRIPTKLNIAGALRDLVAELRKINAENKVMDSRKVRVYAKIETSDLDRQYHQLRRDLEELSRLRPVQITANLRTPRIQIGQGQKVAIDVLINPIITNRALQELKKKIKDKLDGTKVTVDPTLGTVARRRAQFQLGFLGRTRFVRFAPFVDTLAARKVATSLAALAGARFLAQNLEDLGDLLKNIDKNINKITLVSNGIAGIAGWALSASANLFSLSANLAATVQAGLALPGILGGLTIGLLTSFFALRDMNKVMPGFKKGWEQLKKTISANFWAKAEAPMRRLGRELFPQLRRHIALTAVELGDFFGFFADATRDILGGNPLKNMFRDLAKSIDIAKFALRPMLTSIRILGEQGAGQLPRLAKFFVDINQKFANFLARADKSGELQDWINEGIEALKDLGRVISGTARILTGLAKAARAGGGATLDTLANSLADVADIINGPVFQKKFAQAFRAGHEAMNEIQRVSGPALTEMFKHLSDSLVTVLPTVGRTIGTILKMLGNFIGSDAFQAGMISFFTNIGRAVQLLEPAIDPLSRAFGGLLDTIGKAAVQFMPLLTTALTALSEIFLILKPSIDGLVKNLGGAFLGIVKALAPVLTDLATALGPVLNALGLQLSKVLRDNTPAIVRFAKAFGEFLITAIEELTPPLTQVLDQLLPALATLMETLAGTLKRIGPDLGKLVVNLGTELVKALVAIVPKLPDLVQAFIDLLNAVVPLIPQLVPMVTSFIDFATNALPQIMKLLPGAAVALEAIAKAIDHIFQSLSKVFTAMGNSTFLTVLLQSQLLYFQGALEALGTVFDGIGNIVQGVIVFLDALIGKDLGGLFQGLFQILAGAMQTLAGLVLIPFQGLGEILGVHLAEAASQAIQGLIDGFNNAVEAVQRWLQWLTDKIVEWKGPPDRDRTLLEPAGRAIIGGLLRGFIDRFDDVRTTLGNLTRNIPGWVPGMGTTLLGKGKSLINGLIAGIQRQGRAAGVAVHNVGINAGNSMPPLGERLKTAGMNLVIGFANGMADAFHWVVQAATNIANTAIRIVKSALGEHSPSTVFRDIGMNVGLGLVGGLEDQFRHVRSTMQEMASIVSDTTLAAPDIGAVGGGDIDTIGRKVRSQLKVDAEGNAVNGGDVFAPTIVASGDSAKELVGETMFQYRKIKRGG